MRQTFHLYVQSQISLSLTPLIHFLQYLEIKIMPVSISYSFGLRGRPWHNKCVYQCIVYNEAYEKMLKYLDLETTIHIYFSGFWFFFNGNQNFKMATTTTIKIATFYYVRTISLWFLQYYMSYNV